jgi:site-specific recombinase XerD
MTPAVAGRLISRMITDRLALCRIFTANIRNPHTRRAYVRACNRFFAWWQECGLMPAAIRPHDVATYVEQLQTEIAAPSVKQQVATVRMLFDWLVIGQVGADQSGGCRARAQACRQDRQNAGPRRHRVA